MNRVEGTIGLNRLMLFGTPYVAAPIIAAFTAACIRVLTCCVLSCQVIFLFCTKSLQKLSTNTSMHQVCLDNNRLTINLFSY